MLKNRVIMTAMHLGYPYDKERDFYVERARGGVAAITTVAGVTPEGTYNYMLLIHEETADPKAESVAPSAVPSKIYRSIPIHSESLWKSGKDL